MENVFKYYQFSEFFKDESDTFSGNQICFTELNARHFLIFEKNNELYSLFVAKYKSKQEIGKIQPEIVELVVGNYDKSLPEHRIALRQYLG